MTVRVVKSSEVPRNRAQHVTDIDILATWIKHLQGNLSEACLRQLSIGP